MHETVTVRAGANIAVPVRKGSPKLLAEINAGPGKIRQLRREAEKRGLDPNVWFGNVEQFASERIGR